MYYDGNKITWSFFTSFNFFFVSGPILGNPIYCPNFLSSSENVLPNPLPYTYGIVRVGLAKIDILKFIYSNSYSTKTDKAG